jgi:hypothetical protein
MLTKSNPGLVAGHPHADLVLERLPSGELVWLRPCAEVFEDDDALYTITWEGRRALRMAELFGREPT